MRDIQKNKLMGKSEAASALLIDIAHVLVIAAFLQKLGAYVHLVTGGCLCVFFPVL
jgi:hypothetical protein